MLVRRPRDAANIALIQLGERRRDLPLDDSPSNAEWPVPERPDSGTDVAGTAPIQCAERADHGSHRGEFCPVCETGNWGL